MDSRILITGSTGNIGSEVVKQLSSNGFSLRAAVHSKRKTENIRLPGVDLVEIDYDRPETFNQAMTGIDKLFLLTPLVEDMLDVTKNIVNEAANHGIKQIVKHSVINSGMKPDTTLTRMHHEAEEIVKGSGIAYTFLRPNSFMQNFSNSMAGSIKTQGAFYGTSGDSKTSYVDVRDIAAVAVKALTAEGQLGKAYTITGPESLSNKQVAEILSEAIGKPVKYVDLPEDEARKGMLAMGMSDWMVNVLLEFSKAMKEGHSSVITPDVEQVTGRKPIFFIQFARDYVGMFR